MTTPRDLIAQCGHQSYVDYKETGDGTAKIVRPAQYLGDHEGTYIANVTFDFFPQQSIKFTDAPFHEAFVLPGTTAQVNDLLDDAWMHKNIALLEPDPSGTWAISVYKIEEKSACANEPANTCVHYHGWAAARRLNTPSL